jgi:hypothetical protein
MLVLEDMVVQDVMDQSLANHLISDAHSLLFGIRRARLDQPFDSIFAHKTALICAEEVCAVVNYDFFRHLQREQDDFPIRRINCLLFLTCKSPSSWGTRDYA